MAANNTIKIKWDHNGVYRRFLLRLDCANDVYELLMSRIRTVVPDFDGKLAYKDEEGDLIHFSTAWEMRDALHSAPNNQLRIQTIDKAETIKVMNEEKKRTKKVHPYITCDRCDQPLYGMRYKCAVCENFDLCEDCEKEGVHADHAMIRYATPSTPLIDIHQRHRRSWKHRHGYRDPFMQSGIFGQTAAAAATAATQHIAQRAAAAAQDAARQAVAATAQFTDNVTGDNTDGRAPQFRDSVAQGMGYLKEVGTQIQQALANFGIDVDLDVQHGGVSEKIPKTKPATKETENKASNEEENAQKKDKEDVPKNSTFEPKNEDGKRTIIQNPEELDVPFKKMYIWDEEVESPKKKPEGPTEEPESPKSGTESLLADDSCEDWTMMDISITGSKPEPTAPLDISTGNEKCMAGTPFIVPKEGPHDPHCHFIYPDERVALCVEHLEAMGFDNCNGWLTRLALELKGDVGAVIEDMKKDKIYAKHFQKDN